MSQHKDGSVDRPNTIKAGCGIRYDPDELGEDTGFDFSEAEELLAEKNEQNKKQAPEPARPSSSDRP